VGGEGGLLRMLLPGSKIGRGSRQTGRGWIVALRQRQETGITALFELSRSCQPTCGAATAAPLPT
jgi:hypothetical protein